MITIAICIPTYKRLELLSHTLKSILVAEIPTGVQLGDCFVVDNDVDQSAKKFIEEFSSYQSGIINIVYDNYTVKGLSNVRNKLLELVLNSNADFVAFIDDDEFVPRHWLKELIKTQVKFDSDIVVGPVISELPKNTPESIKHWISRSKYRNGQEMKHVSAGNMLIKLDFLREKKLKFDERFNETGAEDTYFGVCAKKLGAKIHGSQEGYAYETVPKSRANLSWILKRSFRGASTFVYILKIEKKYLAILKKSIISLAYIILGILLIPLLLLKSKFKYTGLVKIAEGLGGISGLINLRYREYK